MDPRETGVAPVGLIKYGPLAQEVSGTVGGVTFARVRQGKSVRGWRAPTNKRTPGQRTQRNNLARFSQEWFRDLSAEDRNVWSAYAPSCIFLNPLGEAYTLSGFNMYVRNNAIAKAHETMEAVGLPEAPGFPEVPALGFTLVHATGVLSLVDVTDTPDPVCYLLWRVHTLRPITRLFPYPQPLAFGFTIISEPPPWTLYTFSPLPPGGAGDVAALVSYYVTDSNYRFSTEQRQLVPST